MTDEQRAASHQRWLAAMGIGDFEAAWRETDAMEALRRDRGRRFPECGELLWDGTSFRGRRVIVRCLHGLGDTLQFMRFVPAIAAVASSVTVALQPALLDLFPPSSTFGEVRDGWSDETFVGDVEVEIMELAYALRLLPADLPGPIPYLAANWIHRKATFFPPPKKGRPRVGLIWAASAWDASRSVPAPEWKVLGDLDVEWISLQQDADVSMLPIPTSHWSKETSHLVNAARAMLDLDLLISVDAMPAHLAGALGCPVWVLLKADADWRWMNARLDSPWYPSMRLFRQRHAGDWEFVLREVAQALRAACSLERF
jgi:hypothetical protein